MSDYRLLVLDEKARVLTFETFSADDDRGAWQHIRTWFTAAFSVELWCGSRQLIPEQQARQQQQARVG